MAPRPARRFARLLAAPALFALLAPACAVNPVTGRSELSLVRVSEQEEVDLGAKAYVPAVQQQGGFYRDKALEDYVQQVGMRVARVSHRPGLDYRFRVLNSSVPNAFALPGGFIVVNRGLLTGLGSEAELAAVLAHETGHVTARHSVAAYQRAIAANVLLAGISAAAGSKKGVMEISGITADLVDKGFSREQEREADWLGIDYMEKAGYNPQGAVRLQEYFYEQLEGKKNPLFVEGLFRTHPFSKERLDNARKRIAEKYPGAANDPRYVFNEAPYRQKTDSLREVQKSYEIADEGDRLFGQKKYAEAFEKYNAAVARHPEQGPFHADAGRALFALKRTAEAEAALRKAVRIDDEQYEPHLFLGALRQQQGDFRGAIPDLSRSMDLLPTKQAAGLLAKSYDRIGDKENARKYAEMAK